MIEIVTSDSTGKDTKIGSETMYDPATHVNTVNPCGMPSMDYFTL